MDLYGARSRNRTGTIFRSRDFKSLVSTSFTIRAGGALYRSFTPWGSADRCGCWRLPMRGTALLSSALCAIWRYRIRWLGRLDWGGLCGWVRMKPKSPEKSGLWVLGSKDAVSRRGRSPRSSACHVRYRQRPVRGRRFRIPVAAG